MASTYSRQSELPRLPLPSVEDTMARYLESVRPFARSAEELQDAKAAASAFAASDEALRWQAALAARAERDENWMTPLWENAAYLSYRAPLVLHSNVGIFNASLHGPQPFVAAAIAVAALEVHAELDAERFPPNVDKRGRPSCMRQYRRMFCTTRVPGKARDSLERSPASSHIVVACRNRFFVVNVLRRSARGGRIERIISRDELEASLLAVLRVCGRAGGARAPPLGACTALPRDDWHACREALLRDGGARNAAALRDIESSIFVLCLASGRAGAATGWADLARLSLHGGGDRLAGGGGDETANRWCDKSFCLIVAESGSCGLHIEHSWAEAPASADMFFNRASRAAEQQLRDREAWRHDDAVRARSDAILAAFDARAALFSGPLGLRREARWDFGAWPAGLEWARRASEAVRALVEDSDLCHSVWPGLGAPRMKACGMSPDTFCQLAIQAAHAAVAPALGAEATVCVYETVGLAGYLHGRTETCRAVTSESAAFARALVAWRAAGRPLDGPLRAQARDSARAAAKRHVRTLRRCLQGAGVDRHLLALRLVAMEERSAAAASTDRASTDRAAEMPRVFSQPIFARSGGTACWRISTSNNSYIDHLGGSGAFGAVVPDGYGCVYHYCEEFCAFVCECKRSCGRTTSAAGLSAAVKEAMTDMVRVLAPAERGRL